MLAAAFTSGVAVYHVSLPAQNDLSPPPADSLSELSAGSDELATVKRQRALVAKGLPIVKTSMPTSLSTAVVLSPLAQAKFIASKEKAEKEALKNTLLTKPRAKVTWFDLGPRSPPCLALLFEHEKASYQISSKTLLSRSPLTRICLCAIDIPWYGSIDMISLETKMMHRPIGVLCQSQLNSVRGDVSIMNVNDLGAITCYSKGRFLLHKPALVLPPASLGSDVPESDGYFSSL